MTQRKQDRVRKSKIEQEELTQIKVGKIVFIQ